MLAVLHEFAATKDVSRFLEEASKLGPVSRSMALALVGGELVSTDPATAKNYLTEAYNLDRNKLSCYNLAYYHECHKEVEPMVRHYIEAVNLGNLRAYNQLGLFFFDQPIVPIFNQTPEYCFGQAACGGIVQGFNNLLRLYANNYGKRITTLHRKYKLTRDPIELMTLTLEMLNHGDYFRYISLQGLDRVMMDGEASLNSLLKPMLGECPICLTEADCVNTLCNHTMCIACLNKIIISPNPSCPICRQSLFKEE